MVADLQIARGLDYYTGLVFEGRMEDLLGTMSICAGGRYDALASDGRSTYPGVGISLGITRLVAPLIGRGLLDADRSVPSAVLVALPDEDSRESVPSHRARPACSWHPDRDRPDARPSTVGRSGTRTVAGSRTSGSPVPG